MTNAAVEQRDDLAVGLRGFGALGLLSIALITLAGTVVVGNMVSLPVGAALALAWVQLSRTPWSEIGYVRPASWIASAAGGLVFGVALKFMMKAVVMPLLGADPVNHAFHFLAGNRALLPQAVWAMLVAGFAEETTFRGFLFERMGKLLGSTAAAKATTVLVTSALFGVAHYSTQGLAGVEQGTITGLAFGAIFAVTGRIFPLMCAHAAFDLTALGLIYWDLETRVAHLIFR